MIILGITGGTGAGKTTALNVLMEFGAKIIDCDALYHNMLETCTEMQNEIYERFSIKFENRFDRKKLGAVVFNDRDALNDLNKITHKYIFKAIEDIIAEEKENGRAILAIDAILLIESGLGELCDKVIGVIAPADIRIDRIVNREGISRDYAVKRIASQKDNSFFVENCDIILENNYNTVFEFSVKCKEIFTAMLGGIQ